MRDEVQVRGNRLAVLIDADNASADLIEPLLKEMAKYGTVHVKRIYGDWTRPHLTQWKDKLNKFAIQPIQQFTYTQGKNSTDSALIIDAMDLLYTENFDGFCIVSSDSDFTRLASRIREAGLVVYGFGEKKTPEAFVSACDRFVYTEILKHTESSVEYHSIESKLNGEDKSAAFKKASDQVTATTEDQKLKANKKLVKLLKDAYEAIADEDEWIHLGPFGTQLTKLSPSFDPRNYSYKKLSSLVQAIDLFEIRTISRAIQIRLKN
jgi:uncharacterized LabA/DUF88 family protein